MADTPPPNFDSPLAAIFSKTLGLGNIGNTDKKYRTLLLEGMNIYATGKGEREASRYFVDKAPMLSIKGKVDPYNLLPNLMKNKLKVLGAADLTTSHLREMGLLDTERSRKLAESLRTKMHNLEDPAVLLWDKSKRALFFGSEKYGFAPVPLSRKADSSIISVGYKEYGTSRLRISEGRSLSALEVIHETLFRRIGKGDIRSTVRDLSGFRRHETPGLSPSLGTRIKVSNLLRQGPSQKGQSRAYGISLFGNREVLGVLPGDLKSNRLHSIMKEYAESFKQLNLLQYGVATPGTEAGAEYARHREVVSSYSDKLYTELKYLGVEKYTPFIKPEFLLGGKQFLVPRVEALINQFGNLPIEQKFYEKGLFQMFKLQPLQTRQIQRLHAKGIDVGPAYITERGLKEARESGINNAIFRGQRYDVLVLDHKGTQGLNLIKTELSEQLLFQEGGVILTPTGERKSAQTLPSGQVIIRGENRGGHLGHLLKKDLLKEQRTQYNKKFPVSIEDIRTGLAANTKEARKALTVEQKAARYLFKGTVGVLGIVESNIEEGNILKDVELRGDKFILNFITGTKSPEASEIILGGRRFTGILPEQSHSLYPVIVSGQKIDAIAPMTEFEKMHKPQMLMDNFFSRIMEKRYGVLRQEVFKELGVEFEEVSQKTKKGVEKIRIPRISGDEGATYKKINELLDKYGQSTKESKRRFAEEVLEGKRVSIKTPQGIIGGTIFTITGGMRSDFMDDINLAKKVRMSPMKILMLGQRARLLGYQNIEEEPVYATFVKMMRGLHKGELDVDPSTLELRLKENSVLKESMEQIQGLNKPPKRKKIITLKKDSQGKQGLYVQNSVWTKLSIYRPSKLSNPIHKIHRGRDQVELKRIPLREEFRHKYLGGVPFEQLEDTILDRKKIRDMSYIDLGEVIETKVRGVSKQVRYVPIPADYIRSRKGINGRLLVTKDHPSAPFIDLINQLESGISPQKASEAVGRAITSYVSSLGKTSKGKKGMLEKLHTVLIKDAGRVRLRPQGGNRYTLDNFRDPAHMFDVYVNPDSFQDFLRRREIKDAEKIMDTLRGGGFHYAMLNADPTQRAEHMLLVRVMLAGKAKKPFIGQLAVEASPAIFALTERDVDRDVMNLILLHKGDQKALEESLAKQQKTLTPYLQLHYEMLMESRGITPETSAASLRNINLVTDIKEGLKKFLHQKQSASKGYNITRPIDSLLNVLAFGDEQAIGKLGIKVSGEQAAEAFRASMTPAKMGAASSAMQAFYQGGVEKAGQADLFALGQKLVELRSEMASTPNLSYEEVVNRSAPIFTDFLNSQKKNRLFGSLPQILSGLEEGADFNNLDLEAKKKLLAEKGGKLFAETIGFAYAFSRHISNQVNGPLQVLRKQTGNPDTKLDRVITALGGPTNAEMGIGELEKALDEITGNKIPVAKKTTMEELMSSMNKFFSEPSVYKIAGIGAVLGAGALAIATSGGSQGSPLPPPVDTRQPDDIGPQLTSFNSSPRVYTQTAQIPRYDPKFSQKMSSESILNPFKSNNYTDVVMRDKTHPMHSYIMNAEMRRASQSDF